VLISFELSDPNSADELDILLDEEGLAYLSSQLQFLRDNRTDHIHLMAESWGGYELAEVPVSADARPIRHVRIHLFNKQVGKPE
jgi:hypothetical protein